ncbi:MAG TPA: protein-tyrosine-phosphatase [Flavilitoribacter sp.]|nr:protein-tyrosine-phosphatase [Flavilitoribacter sp.]HMQ88214.1 protein-tyrosine-phosphatase [Flavilitoribacter sp.]
MKIFAFLFLFFFLLTSANQPPIKGPKLYKKLQHYCKSLPNEFDQIPDDRKRKLEELGDYIFKRSHAGQPVTLTVICTHNSRRSHMGQLWFLAASGWYGIPHMDVFSGGIEETAFHPNAVAALKKAGFKIAQLNSENNPAYEASYGVSFKPKAMFSKQYGHYLNPNKDFAAVMVCSEADASCPLVPGSEDRFSLPFDDPRYFDNTAAETEKYDETCRLIARDFFYAVYTAKQKLILEA